MTDNTQNIWLAKLAAWTHDPAEKALVLLRDPAGNEGGTVRELQQALFPSGLRFPGKTTAGPAHLRYRPCGCCCTSHA